ncbi:hypothetical protein JW835_04600 [bacterium]|nr:hypothetical protein [bacterium]
MAIKKIKLEKDLIDRASKLAELAGYSSVDEFITHMIEKELAQLDSGDDSIEEVEKRLQGLGYIS